MITYLSGGTGSVKLLRGIHNHVEHENITVIVNTGDDLELHGLHISPDIDIVIYTLSGIVNEKQGWGIKNDTFNCLKILKNYGRPTWFRLGDRDIATHIYRTNLLNQGKNLSEVTHRICRKLGVKSKILPMSENRLTTMIQTDKGKMTFEEYYVKEKCKPKILRVSYKYKKPLIPTDGVIDSIKNSKMIIIGPGNPIASIGPILEVKGVRQSLIDTKAKIIAVSPIIDGKTIKGPADKMMESKGYDISPIGVSKYYEGIIDKLIIDKKDEQLKTKIEKHGIYVNEIDTIMKNKHKEKKLAEYILQDLR